jgi:hypothetical protein
MLPPERTATGVLACGSSPDRKRQAATAAAPPCSATSRACRASRPTAASISSSPYEEPRDAYLVLDSSAMSRGQAVDAVLKLLISGGWLAAAPDGSGASGTPAPMIRVGPAVRKL